MMTSRFDVAVNRGRQAYFDGLSIDDCPYPDKRKSDGRITWSRAYRNAWRDGWLGAKADSAVENGREP